MITNPYFDLIRGTGPDFRHPWCEDRVCLEKRDRVFVDAKYVPTGPVPFVLKGCGCAWCGCVVSTHAMTRTEAFKKFPEWRTIAA